jgi:cell division protein FtsZ
LRQGVQGISDIITIPGIINRDFADVKTTMAGMGYAVMGTAVGTGSNRAVEAAQAAMASPLLEAGAIDGAKGILINISGSSNLKLSEVNEASTLIQSAAHDEANIIFGAVLDESMGDEVKITVIATGFRQDMPARRSRLLSAILETEASPVPYVRIEPRPVTAKFMSEVEEERLSASRAPEPTPQSEGTGNSGHGTVDDFHAAAPIVAADATVEEESTTLDAEEKHLAAAPEHIEHASDAHADSWSGQNPGVSESQAAVAAERDLYPRELRTTYSEGEEGGENLDIPAFLRRGGL